MTTPDERLRRARAEAGYATAADAARAMGANPVTYTSHENGQRGFARAAARYATFFGVTLDWLLKNEGSGPDGDGPKAAARTAARLAPPVAPARARDVRPARLPPGLMSDMPRDLPVRGTAAGALLGAFQLTPDIIDWVRRPPALDGIDAAYALYVTGDSMSPKFEPGDLVFVHPHRPAGPGDVVIVQKLNHEDQSTEAYIKLLVRAGRDKIRLKQLNPESTIDLDARLVRAVHKVLSNNDLYGV